MRFCSKSNSSHDPDVVSLCCYRTQRRRAQAAAATHARRRTLIALAIGIASLIMCDYVTYQEDQLRLQQQLEVQR